jgi:hypothetical protein
VTNHLAGETSPYLRQHADNPVEWYPWGPAALARAEAEDKPMLVSVGYSACHWCHVMAHESFEDPATAAVMNRLFVNIKVDREERPDVDSVYMEAVQAVSGNGGWPMTVFCMPDGRPFFAGTYFPRSSFVDLLERVGTAWRERRDGLDADATQLAGAVRAGTALPSRSWARAGDPGAARSPQSISIAAEPLMGRFDAEWGGFGRPPKFPQPTMLEMLLQAGVRPGNERVLDAVVTTLDAMASGGIYDHLGGGFARYATDRRWLVPHFEKMLYDNALLARLYTHAWQATGEQRYRQVVAETLGYLLRPPMAQAGAGFSSAEDADSEGVEGRFYVWGLAEVTSVGGRAAVDWYGVSEDGNWEGHNILWRPTRGDLLRPPEVEAARVALLGVRDTRVRPGLDDKVLTEWNAMAVAALAEAGATFGVSSWITAAEEVGKFLLESLRRPGDGRWLRSWQSGAPRPAQEAVGGARPAPETKGGPWPAQEAAGTAQHLAYAGDYAWLVEAFTRLGEATGRAVWTGEARRVADGLLRLFWDDTDGGFHTSGHDAEALIARPKDTHDGALPSANSMAATALLRLGTLTGEARYRDKAEAVIDVMAPALAAAPGAFAGLVAAADLSASGITEVVVTGDRPDLVAAVAGAYHPATVLAWGEPYPSPLWEGRDGPEQAGRAFVCRDYACRAPVSDVATLAAEVSATG